MKNDNDWGYLPDTYENKLKRSSKNTDNNSMYDELNFLELDLYIQQFLYNIMSDSTFSVVLFGCNGCDLNDAKHIQVYKRGNTSNSDHLFDILKLEDLNEFMFHSSLINDTYVKRLCTKYDFINCITNFIVELSSSSEYSNYINKLSDYLEQEFLK